MTSVRAAPAERAVHRRSWAVSRPALRVLLTGLVLLALSVGLVSAAVLTNRPVFVLDEWSYADYLYKVEDGQLWMPPGATASQDVMRDVACRGTEPAFYPTAPPCGLAEYDAESFLNGGVNSAAIHPPTYFLLTYAGAEVVRATGVTDELLTAARVWGAVWMALGLGALVLLARELGARPAGAAVVVVLAAVSPKLVEQWQYVTPDALNVLVGAGLPLVALRWLRGAAPLWVLPVAGALATAVKAPNLLVCCAVAVVLLLAPTTRTARSRGLGAALVLAGAGAATVLALVVRTVLTPDDLTPSALDLAQQADAFSLRWLLDNLAAFLSPLGRPGTAAYAPSVVVAYLLFGATFTTAVLTSGGARQRAVALGTSALVLAGPLLLVVLTWVATHQYFPMQERYGFTLLPAAFAVVASALQRPWQLAVGGALAALYAVTAVAAVT